MSKPLLEIRDDEIVALCKYFWKLEDFAKTDHSQIVLNNRNEPFVKIVRLKNDDKTLRAIQVKSWYGDINLMTIWHNKFKITCYCKYDRYDARNLTSEPYAGALRFLTRQGYDIGSALDDSHFIASANSWEMTWERWDKHPEFKKVQNRLIQDGCYSAHTMLDVWIEEMLEKIEDLKQEVEILNKDVELERALNRVNSNN